MYGGGVDVPVLFGWRSTSDLYALWVGPRGGLEALGGIRRNGAASPRLAHSLNVCVEGVEGGALHRALRRQLAVSGGSACSSGEPSHVLAALGLSRLEAAASISSRAPATITS